MTLKADRATKSVPAIVGQSARVADIQHFELAERAADKLATLAAQGLPISKTQAAKVVSALTRNMSAKRQTADNPTEKSAAAPSPPPAPENAHA